MFAILFVIYVVMLISDSTLDLGALARRQVYNALPQAIFVVGNDSVKTGNPAANALLTECARTFESREEADKSLRALFEACRQDERNRGSAVPLGDRYYDVEIQPIDPAVGEGHPPLGWIMIADDVTGTVRMQAELARAAEDAEADAQRDPLTGLSNRRPLEPRFREMTAEAMANGLPVQLLIVDVDYFKSINDTYGHDQGDTALVLVADTLRGIFRQSDAVFRIGGEEFLALAVGMSEKAMFHRLRMASAKLQQNLKNDGTFHAPVTFSAGLAEWPSEAETLEDLLRKADRRLLEAKRKGRNRFVGRDATIEGVAIAGARSPSRDEREARPDGLH
jgi:diguanylate cyclase (GGDEF)-like protein